MFFIVWRLEPLTVAVERYCCACSHSLTHKHSVGLPYTRDRPVARLPNNTQHSQDRDIHAAGGIRNRISSKRSAVDLRLRPRGHWDRLYEIRGNKLPREVLVSRVRQVKNEVT